MKKKKIISALIVVAVLLTAYLIIIGIQVREKEKREKEILLKRQSLKAEGLLRNIQANGEVIIQDGKVVISDFEIREPELVMSVYYYNWMTESTITFEQIKEQVYIYVESYEFDESTEELEDFFAFVEEEGVYTGGISRDYIRYDNTVYFLLKEQDLDIWTATREQLEAACKEALEELGY